MRVFLFLSFFSIILARKLDLKAIKSTTTQKSLIQTHTAGQSCGGGTQYAPVCAKDLKCVGQNIPGKPGTCILTTSTTKKAVSSQTRSAKLTSTKSVRTTSSRTSKTTSKKVATSTSKKTSTTYTVPASKFKFDLSALPVINGKSAISVGDSLKFTSLSNRKRVEYFSNLHF
jgi:hypothetical protein